MLYVNVGGLRPVNVVKVNAKFSLVYVLRYDSRLVQVIAILCLEEIKRLDSNCSKSAKKL